VGSLPAQGCGFTYDGENEGHGGILATDIVSQSQLPPWLDSAQPDIVMMHLGTNDVWNNKGADVIIDAFSTLVDQMRENNPAMTILVSCIEFIILLFPNSILMLILHVRWHKSSP
jgi:mannan endo-1,4-beta-mannosidase